MNKRNTSRKIAFMILVNGRLLGGFRLERSGFYYGLTDSKDEALMFDSRSDAVVALEILTLVSKLEGLVVPSTWVRT